MAPIKKGSFIAEYWGRRIPNAEADKLNTRYLFKLNNRWTIDGSDRRNLARYINHSCKPNAETDVVRGAIVIRAIRNIAPGDEITYNYGRSYFETFIKPMGCKCRGCSQTRRAKTPLRPHLVSRRFVLIPEGLRL